MYVVFIIIFIGCCFLIRYGSISLQLERNCFYLFSMTGHFRNWFPLILNGIYFLEIYSMLILSDFEIYNFYINAF